MDQTPIHEMHNPDLLRFIPTNSKNLIEVGCSSGALAREFKKISPDAHYFGVEIDQNYAQSALRYCDQTLVLNIDDADENFWISQKDRDCWIFGDTLEHLKNPWAVLERINEVLPKGGCVVACIPNAQHWSLQVRLNMGDFRYESDGLLDKTHLRWFTRQTIIEMFVDAGFEVQEGFPRILQDPLAEKYFPIIQEMAKLSGVDPQMALADALPIQYVIKAVKI